MQITTTRIITTTETTTTKNSSSNGSNSSNAIVRRHCFPPSRVVVDRFQMMLMTYSFFRNCAK